MDELIKVLIKSNLIALLKNLDTYDSNLYSGYIRLNTKTINIDINEYINKSVGHKRTVPYNKDINSVEFEYVYIEGFVDDNLFLIEKNYQRILDSSTDLEIEIENEKYQFIYNEYTIDDSIKQEFNDAKTSENININNIIRDFNKEYDLKSKNVFNTKIQVLINKYK